MLISILTLMLAISIDLNALMMIFQKDRFTAWSVRIGSFSGPYFPTFGVNTERFVFSVFSPMRGNTDQKNSEYGHFSRSVIQLLDSFISFVYPKFSIKRYASFRIVFNYF